MPAGRGLRDQQARDVGAGNQQHRNHDRHQQIERPRERTLQVVEAATAGDERHAWRVVREHLRRLGGDDLPDDALGFSRGLSLIDARGEAGHHRKAPVPRA